MILMNFKCEPKLKVDSYHAILFCAQLRGALSADRILLSTPFDQFL